MAAKNTKKKTTKKNQKSAAPQESIFYKFRKEIWGIVCLILAVVILMSNYDRASILGTILSGLFGQIGLIVLPIGLVLCFITLTFHGNRPVLMRLLCAVSAVLLCCAIAHLAVGAETDNWKGGLVGRLYSGGKEGLTGGVFGGILAMLFSLLGGEAAAWVLCILLLLVALPSSLNLTLTGLLRAINNRREQAAKERKEAEAAYREPAEVLVEHVVNRHQQLAERRQERKARSRQDFDLPVDDPPAAPVEQTPKTKRKRKVEEAPVQPIPEKPAEPKPTVRPQQFVFDESDYDKPLPPPVLPDEPLPGSMPRQEHAASAKPVSRPAAVSEPAPEVQTSAAREPVPQTVQPTAPAVQPMEKEKVKSKDAAIAAAEIEKQIEDAAELQVPVYEFPPVELLEESRSSAVNAQAEMRENSRRLTEKLACFNVDAQIVNVTRGPSVTMYELQLAQGVRLNRITGLADDIALELGASGVRISAIPDRNSVVGIEVPNKSVSMVKIREVVDSPSFRNASSPISFAVGKDIAGSCIIGDIAKMPHVLVAGTTGSGKSVCMNSLIISLLYKSTPEDVKLIMIDPKMVEFGIYNGIPQLLVPVVTDPKKAAGALQWTVTEMMRRYSALNGAGVREIESYNKLAASDPDVKHMPQIVVLIDELADLMLVAGKEVEESICRIAQMGRAAGIHLVIATQRPSADVITGLMKANIPSRIAFAVSSAMESRIILDTVGAEKLIGKGDMLFAPLGKGKPRRVQGCFIDDSEVERVVSFVKEHSSPNYSDDVQKQIELKAAQTGKGGASQAPAGAETPQEEEGDELLPAAVEVILETKQASVSMLQRRLKLGYARAARIVDEMEERGIVGPYEGSKPRQLLITKEQWEQMQASGSVGNPQQSLFDELPENPPVEEEIP